MRQDQGARDLESLIHALYSGLLRGVSIRSLSRLGDAASLSQCGCYLPAEVYGLCDSCVLTCEG